MTEYKLNTAKIRTLTHEGRGIADVSGKTVFIEGALLGETVRYQIKKRKKNYDEAIVREIEVPSQDRVLPQCRHFEICGGCSLQHMKASAQLAFKQSVLLEQLTHFGKVTPKKILEPLKSHSFGYRRKARLGVRYVAKKEKVLVGFREKESNKLADIQSCEILHPNIGLRLEALQSLITSLMAYKTIPQIEVAMGDNKTALILRHMKPLSLEDQQKCIEFAKKHDFHFYLQPGGIETVKALWPENVSRLSYLLPEFNIEFLFHPLDFTQINAGINHQMVALAIQSLNLTPSDRVLDLFCGLGNFSLPTARFAEAVVGVEGSNEMVVRARDNAKHNTLTNVEFFSSNLQEDCQNAEWAKRQYDKVLLDPPRSGALDMMSLIPKLGAKRVVYISCNPATLARDVGVLVKEGYVLEAAGVMDMFPNTTHVESIAVLQLGLLPATLRSRSQ